LFSFLLALAAATRRGVGAATGVSVRRRAAGRAVVLASIVIRVVVATIRVGICATREGALARKKKIMNEECKHKRVKKVRMEHEMNETSLQW
jgi:hypothetical protein